MRLMSKELKDLKVGVRRRTDLEGILLDRS